MSSAWKPALNNETHQAQTTTMLIEKNRATITTQRHLWRNRLEAETFFEPRFSRGAVGRPGFVLSFGLRGGMITSN